ncbi:hypothetical protein BJ741DRAFT_670098 [Chytriomyces cf. hyalinus JEL632]|nr:hypothetical protein BJ741DRAFT_670098 [Chytriomyces cf. hyalinus JEL632]
MDTEFKELEMAEDGSFIIPKKSRVISYRWQDGFVSPFLATPPNALEALVRVLQALHTMNGTTSKGLLDLGSGKGDILFAINAACKSGGCLEGLVGGPFVGVDLDAELVAESVQKALEIDVSKEVLFVRGNVVTMEVLSEAADLALFQAAGLDATSVETLARDADIVTVFLLTEGLGKMIPFLRGLIEQGKTVISVLWSVEYSGSSLEEYRDMSLSDSTDIKVYRRQHA